MDEDDFIRGQMSLEEFYMYAENLIYPEAQADFYPTPRELGKNVTGY
ncbi:MAG: hypothetical protein ACLRNW_13140 [Neglectibacter sp.]